MSRRTQRIVRRLTLVLTCGSLALFPIAPVVAMAGPSPVVSGPEHCC